MTHLEFNNVIPFEYRIYEYFDEIIVLQTLLIIYSKHVYFFLCNFMNITKSLSFVIIGLNKLKERIFWLVLELNPFLEFFLKKNIN